MNSVCDVTSLKVAGADLSIFCSQNDLATVLAVSTSTCFANIGKVNSTNNANKNNLFICYFFSLRTSESINLLKTGSPLPKLADENKVTNVMKITDLYIRITIFLNNKLLIMGKKAGRKAVVLFLV